ncbi:MAG TPA: hypothetical protein VGM37_00990 [Armatimonadota bacterium]|jgi:hypothetical protein
MRTRNLAALTLLFLSVGALADTLELTDGSVLKGCYVRDEAIRYLVWENFDQVGGPARAIPRSQVKSFKLERAADWDAHPSLPDLSVTFIEMTPKLAGLHGRVDYDDLGRPVLKGGSLPDLGDRAILHPEEVVKGLKLKYAPGEPITLTAHVKNAGFAAAKPFAVTWLMDGQVIGHDRCKKALKEMEETTFALKWNWREGRHTAALRIDTVQPEIATINNSIDDPLWGWSYYFIVSPGRAAAWHTARTAYGTFSFEDFYRWHVDLMNTLFAATKYPSSPDGITARVRLDRIVYADDPEKAQQAMTAADGIGYHQGGWTWMDDEDRNKSWKPATQEWRNSTEWSLPHELGHQLGLVDYYNLDCEGSPAHVWPDNGEKVTHFQNHPITMMHWHGPQVYSEADAGYFNMREGLPGGYFGDYYFAIPAENWLAIQDVNGRPLSGAKVSVFQRGMAVDPKGQPQTQEGVTWYPVIEDGNFDKPISPEPVISGVTDVAGRLRLPNRPAAEVVTLNGFHRMPNPFGNINVVGNRGDMLVKVEKDGASTYFSLEITDFVNAWFRGSKDSYTTTLKTTFRSVDSPLPPAGLHAESVDADHVKLTWDPPAVPRERNYLDRAIGFRVYRRISDAALNDRPWFPVATLGPVARDAVVDLRQFPDDTYWFTRTDRFAVSAIGELGLESEPVSVVMATK